MTAKHKLTGIDVFALWNKRIKGENITKLLLVTFVLCWFSGLILFPLIGIIKETVKNGSAIFVASLNSPAAFHSFLLTLIMTTVAVVLNTLLGTIMALVFARQDFKGKLFLESLIDLPFAVSPVMAGFMFIILFGPNGWIGSWFEAMNIKIIYALPGIGFPVTCREQDGTLDTLFYAFLDNRQCILTRDQHDCQVHRPWNGRYIWVGFETVNCVDVRIHRIDVPGKFLILKRQKKQFARFQPSGQADNSHRSGMKQGLYLFNSGCHGFVFCVWCLVFCILCLVFGILCFVFNSWLWPFGCSFSAHRFESVLHRWCRFAKPWPPWIHSAAKQIYQET